MSHFDPKTARRHNSGSTLRIFFEILHNERNQEVHENYVNSFSEKNIILGKWVILGLNIV